MDHSLIVRSYEYTYYVYAYVSYTVLRDQRPLSFCDALCREAYGWYGSGFIFHFNKSRGSFQSKGKGSLCKGKAHFLSSLFCACIILVEDICCYFNIVYDIYLYYLYFINFVEKYVHHFTQRYHNI